MKKWKTCDDPATWLGAAGDPFGVEAGGRMTVHSHTSLSTFRNCPHRYKLQYIDKIRSDQEFLESFLGKRVHEALETLYKDILHGHAATQEELLGYYEAGWDKHWSDRVHIVRKAYTAADAREVGRRCLTDYYKRHHPFRRTKVLAIEKKVQIEIPDGDKVHQIKGFIDRVDEAGDGNYEIHDYKTSQSLPVQADMDKDRQLALYQIGLPVLWPDVKEVELVWHYLVFDKELRSRRRPEDLAALQLKVLEDIHAIEEEVLFAPNVSALCDWCGYKDICPAWKQPMKVAALPKEEYSRERGVNLVERFAALEQKKEELRFELNRVEDDIAKLEADAVTYAEKEGITRLEGKEGEVEVHKKEELVLLTKTESPDEWKHMTQLLRESKHWTEISEVSRTHLKKALEEKRWDKELMENLSRFVRRVVKWSVRFHRHKDEDD